MLILIGVIVALIAPAALSTAQTLGVPPAAADVGRAARPWRRRPPPPSSSRIRAAPRRPRVTRSRRRAARPSPSRCACAMQTAPRRLRGRLTCSWTPASSRHSPVVMSLVGNVLPAGSIPAFSPNPKVTLSGNVLHIQAGQLLIAPPYVTAAEGLLATLTVQTKSYANCPAGGTPSCRHDDHLPAQSGQLRQRAPGAHKIHDDPEHGLPGLHAGQHADPDQHV